jgi:hypothetical protein
MRDIIAQLQNDQRMNAAAADLLGATRAAMADPSKKQDMDRSIAGMIVQQSTTLVHSSTFTNTHAINQPPA